MSTVGGTKQGQVRGWNVVGRYFNIELYIYKSKNHLISHVLLQSNHHCTVIDEISLNDILYQPCRKTMYVHIITKVMV